MATQITHEPTLLETGTWRVDPDAGKVGFTVRTMWGLSQVRGSFSRFRGTLTVRSQGVAGELVIEAASLDTGHAKRDSHLRSDDFFGAESHPHITFTTSSLRLRDDNVTVAGELRIRDQSIPLELPVEIVSHGDRMWLRSSTSVSRERAGLTWNKLGMIRGDAQLEIELELSRA